MGWVSVMHICNAITGGPAQSKLRHGGIKVVVVRKACF